MMAHTDRHLRYLLRLISRRVMLYSEMLTTGALLHGDPERRLAFDPAEHPLALQLGGSDPAALAAAAHIAEDAGYDEVNLNLGCPSERVQSGRFGACLMAEPELVADCVGAMLAAVRIPVTVKTRIGIDARDSYEELAAFVARLAAAGCGTFIVHARKAWLSGLSPKQNRELPPLRHEVVHRLKRDFPALEIILNGGIRSVAEARAQLEHVDGVMIGRAACSNPFLLAQADREIFGATTAAPERHEVLLRYTDYAERQLAAGALLPRISRHLLGVFQGRPGARAFRRHLATRGTRPGAGVEVLRQALALAQDRQARHGLVLEEFAG